jgi:hypothetical protein
VCAEERMMCMQTCSTADRGSFRHGPAAWKASAQLGCTIYPLCSSGVVAPALSTSENAGGRTTLQTCVGLLCTQ